LLEVIDQVSTRLWHGQNQRQDGELIRCEFALAAHMLRHTCQRGLLAQDTDAGHKVSQSRLLSQDLDKLLDKYKAIWLERNRPYGLEETLPYFKTHHA
jgi:hypothetical protein